MSDVVVPLRRDGEMPAAPIDPKADLRGFGFMPLDVGWLLDSDFFVLSAPAEFKAGFALWCRAWHQLPAGSLPADERLLAHLSGTGSDWPGVRAGALRGWSLAADGRLYNPVMTDLATEAWDRRLAYQARGVAGGKARRARALDREADRQAARLRKPAQRARGRAENVTPISRDIGWDNGVTPPGTSRGTHSLEATENKGSSDIELKECLERGQGQRQKREESKSSVSSLRSDTVVPSPTSPAAVEPAVVAQPRPVPPPITTPDPRTRLFREGLAIATSMLRKPEAPTRALIGRWLKQAKDDAALVHEVIGDAALEDLADPVSWITAALKARVGSAPASRSAATGTPAEPVPDLGADWAADRARQRPWWASHAKRSTFRGVERWAYGAYAADAAENKLLDAAGLLRSWPGDLRPLVDWLTEGWELGVIERVVREFAAREGYTPPRSLKLFDAAIRATPKRAGRF